MKFVAAKDFANVKSLNLTLDPKADNFVHELHVPKGHRFEVGTGETLELEPVQANKVLIAQLIVSKSAVGDNEKNKPLIKKIDAEVAAANKAAAKQEKAQSLPELIAAAVAKALVEAGVGPKKTA